MPIELLSYCYLQWGLKIGDQLLIGDGYRNCEWSFFCNKDGGYLRQQAGVKLVVMVVPF